MDESVSQQTRPVFSVQSASIAAFALSSLRLFGVDDDQGEKAESERSEVTGPSYAATAALPASGPVTATLTG